MREENISKLISAFLDDELSARKRLFVIKKLESDSAWQSSYASLKGIKDLLGSVRDDAKVLSLSPSFDAKLYRKLSTYRSRGKKWRSFLSFQNLLPKLTYALVTCSVLFIFYVSVEIYLLNNAKLKFFPPISGTAAASDNDLIEDRSSDANNRVVSSRKEILSRQFEASKKEALTAVISSSGDLSVSKDNRLIVIDIYSGKIRDGIVDSGTEELFVNIISNIGFYRKIYLSHYRKDRDFANIKVPVLDRGSR